MKNRAWVAVVIFSVFVLGTGTATWACKSAGPNKHVGNVMAIDAKAKTFTIRDAETDHPMTFEATDKLLAELKVNDRVMVGFKEEAGKMIAVEVHS
ncbi:MAG: copper-binding protein [Nitrospirae bacterium]|nr:copper-binding protein [Nitrospirota bacterium]